MKKQNFRKWDKNSQRDYAENAWSLFNVIEIDRIG